MKWVKILAYFQSSHPQCVCTGLQFIRDFASLFVKPKITTCYCRLCYISQDEMQTRVACDCRLTRWWVWFYLSFYLPKRERCELLHCRRSRRRRRRRNSKFIKSLTLFHDIIVLTLLHNCWIFSLFCPILFVSVCIPSGISSTHSQPSLWNWMGRSYAFFYLGTKVSYVYSDAINYFIPNKILDPCLLPKINWNYDKN